MKYQDLVKRAEENLFIIAEAGVNHNGNIDTAKKLIDVAKDCGCDAVKFQTWITEKVYSKTLSQKPDYQKRSTDEAESEYDTVKRLELSFGQFREIKAYCDKVGIIFFSTPDEAESADFLSDLGVSLFKTASQDVTNIPFLRHIARKNIPMIFSTGGSTLDEVKEAVGAISECTDQLIILHCVSSYPAPLDQQNLLVIPEFKSLFKFPIGFSDHTVGVEAACAALAVGARFFEKHFTLDRNAAGPDHQASLDPAALKHYVSVLRSLRKGLGSGKKEIMPSEANVSQSFRRFLVTARALEKGHVFSEEDFLFKKVNNGIIPKELDKIIGTRASRNLDEDITLSWDDVELTKK